MGQSTSLRKVLEYYSRNLGRFKLSSHFYIYPIRYFNFNCYHFQGENYEINLGDFAALLSRDTDSADRSKSTIIITVTSPVDPVIKDLQESEG